MQDTSISVSVWTASSYPMNLRTCTSRQCSRYCWTSVTWSFYCYPLPSTRNFWLAVRIGYIWVH